MNMFDLLTTSQLSQISGSCAELCLFTKRRDLVVEAGGEVEKEAEGIEQGHHAEITEAQGRGSLITLAGG